MQNIAQQESVSIVIGKPIFGDMDTSSTLAALLKERIDSAYGGSQSAFSRATGFTTQTISAWLKGRVSLPQIDARRRLAKELGISHVDLLVIVGELDASEVEAAGVQGVVDNPLEDEVMEALRTIPDLNEQDVAVIRKQLEWLRDAKLGRI